MMNGCIGAIARYDAAAKRPRVTAGDVSLKRIKTHRAIGAGFWRGPRSTVSCGVDNIQRCASGEGLSLRDTWERGTERSRRKWNVTPQATHTSPCLKNMVERDARDYDM